MGGKQTCIPIEELSSWTKKDEKIRIWIRDYTFKKWNLTRQKKEEISTSHHQSLKVNVVHIWYVFTLKLRFHDYRTITKTSFRLTSTVISWFGKPRSGSIPMITLHPHWFHWNSQIGLNDLAQHHKVNICGHSRSARD